MTDTVEITTWVERARTVQMRKGTFASLDLVSAEDLAAIKHVSTVIVGILGVTGGFLPPDVTELMLTLAEDLQMLREELTDPERNWKDE